jgi:hypothetical protein
VRIDAREQFAAEYVLPAIKANALYGGGYPLFTALGRPLIAKLAVERARSAGCDTVAHGCTGKGNDQVRIEGTVATLAPDLRVLAPVREWRMGREEEIAYAREHGIPVKGGSEAPPYSIDDNLWGRSSEGGPIEDLSQPPRDDVFDLVTAPEDAPDDPQNVTIEFERGCPVAIDGERLGLVELLERAGEVGARHGVGVVDHVEFIAGGNDLDQAGSGIRAVEDAQPLGGVEGIDQRGAAGSAVVTGRGIERAAQAAVDDRRSRGACSRIPRIALSGFGVFRHAACPAFPPSRRESCRGVTTLHRT